MQKFKTSSALAFALVAFLSSGVLFAQDEAATKTEVVKEGKAPADAVASDDKVSDGESPDDDSKQAQSPKADSKPTASPTAAVKQNPGRYALTFDDLKFDMEKTEAFDRNMLSTKINGYHGGKIKIRGYIRPNFKQSGITKFVFVRDNKECCFGPEAAIFDNILVRLEKGNSTNYTVRPVIIEGDFVLKEYHGDNGNVWSLYRMYNAKIK